MSASTLRPALRRFSSSLLATIFVLAAHASGWAADDTPRSWLDVRQLGASGSTFETTAAAVAGSRQITVARVGDFQVGQGVMVSKCNIRYTPKLLWGTGEPYRNQKPLAGSVEVRGYDGSAGSWVTYLLDIEPSAAPAFRWSSDLGRTWHARLPITHQWQPLSDGVEVRLNPRDWESGYVVAFGARDQLLGRIEKIEGRVLTLSTAANRTVKDALVRHNDTLALQAAVDQALREKRNVFVPLGHYRLAHGLQVNNPAAIVIQGASAVDTWLDISDGQGPCITLRGGTDVTLRNFRMTGFMGFDQRDRAGYINTHGSTYIWGFALKPCNAVTIDGTERVLVENCHASQMSGECFVSGGLSRGTVKPGQSYSQAITYLRCTVTDCARNAFNDVLCGTENTSVLQCRIVDVGGCSWEGASRFVKFVGNYVRNGGTVAMGNLGPGNRDLTYPDLGAGQHIIADNVFEGGTPYGGCAVRSARGATQVIIRNNLFVNFNSSAVEIGGAGSAHEYPSANTTVCGNIIDMTAVGQPSAARTAITVRADDTLVADNQIYVRGSGDPKTTGIELREPARNAIVHDNLLHNCGTGIFCRTARSTVAAVVDATTFAAGAGSVPIGMQPHLYRGWQLAWFRGQQPIGSAVVDVFEPATSRFTLRQPQAVKPGDGFEVYPPAANWNIHDNTVAGCLQPVLLDAHGGATSLLKDNLLSRGEAAGNAEAIRVVRGQFALVGNRLEGFGPATSQAPAAAAKAH